MNQSVRQRRGQHGEAAAEQWLQARGLQTIERNYRCRGGEIDLIMVEEDTDDGSVLVFVEVRLRAPGAPVAAIETVDRGKQQRLIRAARHFLMSQPQWADHACRFDVVAVEQLDETPCWIRNAFE